MFRNPAMLAKLAHILAPLGAVSRSQRPLARNAGPARITLGSLKRLADKHEYRPGSGRRHFHGLYELNGPAADGQRVLRLPHFPCGAAAFRRSKTAAYAKER